MEFRHISVMPDEVLQYLAPKPGETFVDCTMGGAGHSRSILEKILPGGTLIGVDQDITAVTNAQKLLAARKENVRIVHDNYVNLPAILEDLEITGVDGILLDLGLSFHQIEDSGRGFSFRKSEPLDMRMDVSRPQTAADMVGTMDARALAEIFFKFGEERFSRQVARAIVEEREKAPIVTSDRLAEIVDGAIPKRVSAKQKIHPATRVFQALRIAVNSELSVLHTFMEEVEGLLNPGGRVCVLSFHSLEDRIVKKRIKALSKGCTCPPDFPMCVCGKKPLVKPLTPKTVRPTEREIEQNPMARSTKLRAFEKLP